MTTRIELTELERKKLSEAAAMSYRSPLSWRPIETAPTDGTPFIGIQTFESSKLVGMAIVKANPKLPPKTWQCCESVMIHASGTIDGQGVDTGLPFCTHWMPLPEPPK